MADQQKIDFDFACRDDCLDLMVPSDLRKLVAERDTLLSALTEREREVERLRKDAIRLQWLQDHYAYVMGYPNGRKNGMEVLHDPTGTGSLRNAIDAALADQKEDRG